MLAVSVIIPIYNVEEYIEECLVSVMKQTLKEIEIICVNDGTPDHSMQIIEKYAKEDERIVIINKENGGLSSARNAGLRVARGEYVYFLDSDDYLKAETLEALYSEVTKNNLDTIYFDAESFFENSELQETQQSYAEYYQRENIYGEIVSGQQMLADMVRNRQFRASACLQMNRRSLLEEHHIVFKEGIIHEDNLFAVRVTLYAERVKHVAKKYYMRRLREDSIMTSRTAKRSAYGYFISMMECVPEVTSVVKDKEILSAYLTHIGRMRNNAAAALRYIPQDEFDAFQIETNVEEGFWFQYLVKDYAKVVRSRDQQAEKSKKRIQRLRMRIKELRKVEKSTSYRLGRIITALPRRVKVLKQNGIKSLMKSVLFRIAPSYYVKRFTKISIIVPVYNGEKYLDECLRSLREQTMRDIEIICVDDQSTDHSVEILKRYARRDKRFKILHQNHLGAGCARNLGIKHAKGAYLLFLDCDDYFSPDMCERIYRRARKKKAEIVLFGARRIDMQTGKKEDMTWVLRRAELPKNQEFSGKDIAARLFQVTSNCPWSKLFSKEFVLKKKLEFQDTKHANDTYFVRSAMAMAERIVVDDGTYVTYRYNDGANTQSVKHLAPLEFYKAFLAVKEKLKKEGLFECYKHSYTNWIITESLFNYETMKSEEAKQIIRDKLLSDGFENLGVEKCTREDIDNPDLYDRFIEFTKG